MNVLQEALRLLTEPPGDLVYFLVTLFALQQALLPALSRRRSNPAAIPPRRWTWALGVMLLGRAVLILIALLGNAEVLVPVLILPPLERFIEVVGVALFVWALAGFRPARWQTVVLLLILIAAVAFFAVYDAPTWPARYVQHYAYNGSLQEWVWEMSAIVLLGVGLLSLPFIRPPRWEWTVGVIVFWLAGHGAQLLWPTPHVYFSDWGRLAALVALPLLTTFIYQALTPTASIVKSAPVSMEETPVPFTSSTMDVHALQALLEGVETARELEPALIITSSRLARFLKAEICVIALTEETEAPQVRAVATHPPTGLLEAPLLDLSRFELLHEAWQDGKSRILQEPDLPSWFKQLYQILGFGEAGPLLVLPMQARGERVGLLLLGNPESGMRWDYGQLLAPNVTASLLAAAIVRTQQRGASIFSLREPGEQLEQKLTTVQAKVEALERQLQQAQDALEIREREAARLRQQLEAPLSQPSDTELAFWQQEVQEMVTDREVLIKERDRLGQELAKLRPHLETLMAERNQLRKALATAEGALETLQAGEGANVEVGLLVTNEDGEIRMADALARRMLRMPEGEVTWTPIDGAYATSEWTQTVAELLSPAAHARRSAHLSLQVGSRTIEADMVTLMGRDEKPDGLVVTLRAEESRAEQREAIVGMANEFRTPMTSITGYTDLLLNEQPGILTEMQRQFLERVKANVEQMNQLLTDLIRLASPDARTVDLEPQPVKVAAVVEEGVLGLATRFRERSLKIELDLPPDLPPVRADRDSLYQILLRLLSNAALCSREGSQVTVAAAAEREGRNGGYVRIQVTDTGGGIATDDLPKVFRRFYRANQPLIQGMGERGVGMAVVKTLVEANGGRIWVESKMGQGSTFSLLLPANGG